jgi:hypothetical protein
VEEQDKIEAEDTDVEGHRTVSRTVGAADAPEDKARHASDESDDPDVEGHRHKVVPRTVN